MLRLLSAMPLFALPPLHEAFRQEFLRGDPAAASACYAEALKAPSGPGGAGAGLGLARCREALGESKQASLAYGWVLSREEATEVERAAALEGLRRRAPELLRSREAGPGSWLVSKPELEEALGGAFRILAQVKIEPYREKDGRVGGLLLRALEPDSLPAQRGLQAYDLVRSLNGRPLTSTGAAEILALLASLKDEPVLTVEIERLGAPLSLRYEILGERELALKAGPFPEPLP